MLVLTGWKPGAMATRNNRKAPSAVVGPKFNEDDLRMLIAAKRRLEHPSLTARITAVVGRPLEAALRMLPDSWHARIGAAAETVLLKALDYAVLTLRRTDDYRSRDWVHKTFAVLSGFVGGLLGIVALPLALPLSIGIIFRSIADIARSEGHDLSVTAAKLACLEVFALGGTKSRSKPGIGTYWIVREALSAPIAEAADRLQATELTDRTAPALGPLIAQITSRFGVVASAQGAAMLIPVIGAATGGTINYLLMEHFQHMAKGHFVILRLEKKYATALVRRTYDVLVV
jgi:hypothetical protein